MDLLTGALVDRVDVPVEDDRLDDVVPIGLKCGSKHGERDLRDERRINPAPLGRRNGHRLHLITRLDVAVLANIRHDLDRRQLHLNHELPRLWRERDARFLFRPLVGEANRA